MPRLTSDREHLFMPKEAVASAWDGAPEGVSTITHEGRAYRVRKDKKMLVMSPDFSSEKLKHNADFHIAVFPRPEHHETFINAEKGLAGHGASRFNPGAVGSMLIESHGPHQPLSITYLQSHYKSSGEHGIGNKLSRNHLGWIERGLEEALESSNTLGRELQIHGDTFYRGERDMLDYSESNRIKQLDNALEKLKKKGVTTHKDSLGIILRGPKSKQSAKRHHK